MRKTRKTLSSLCLVAALFVVGPAQSGLFQVTVDTVPLFGQSAALGFDFTNGGDPSNSVVISGFGYSSDATLGNAYLTTDLVLAPATPLSTPATSVVLSDASGALFVEFLQYITLGTSFTFTFSPSGDLAAPTPDAFLFYILVGTEPPPQPPDLLPLLVFAPTNPDGTGDLVRFDIGVTVTAQPQWYPGETIPSDPDSDPQPIGVTVTATAVPEPGALALAIAGLLALGVARPVRTMRLRMLSST